MYLESLELTNFRCCLSTRVHFQSDLTVLVGENNSGKSTVLDSLRLVTSPSDGRRDRYAEPDDISRCASVDQFSITTEYASLNLRQKGRWITALAPDPASNRALFGINYRRPVGDERRGQLDYFAGSQRAPDLERDARDALVRHVFLPPLRDAQRLLSSGSSTRIGLILKHLTTDTSIIRDFEQQATDAFRGLEQHDVIKNAKTQIGVRLRSLTQGVHPQNTTLSFVEAELMRLAGDLRFRLASEGMTPEELAASGLGYANLLFLATVLVELQSAADTDLTLFLVEEPEAHLHPQLQSLVLEYLREQASSSSTSSQGRTAEGRIQIVVSSHSPHLTSALSVKHLVVMKPLRCSPSPPDVSLSGGSDTNTLAPPLVQFEGVAVAIPRLRLEDSVRRKIDRYLDVTRSSLLFAPHVLLIEGLAEALLLPPLARRYVLKAKAELDRFIATALVPIDGVDFEPYVRLLLTPTPEGHRVAHRVIVVTDGDPDAPGDRPAILRNVAVELNAVDRLVVCSAQRTLEADLFDEGNAQAMWQALENMGYKPLTLSEWKSGVTSGSAFSAMMQHKRVRKGDFAQHLAEILETPDGSFKVPDYLRLAIEGAALAR